MVANCRPPLFIVSSDIVTICHELKLPNIFQNQVMSKNSENFVERQIVLGAGASDGFPLGGELIELIIFLGLEGMPSQIKKEEKHFSEMVRKIAQDIKILKPSSIDYYAMRLEEDYYNVVRSIIIAIIESHQPNKEDLERGDINTWYGHLQSLLVPQGVAFVEAKDRVKKIKDHLNEVGNSLRIITFNYDISLEKYLHKFLKAGVFPKSEDSEFLIEAKKAIFEKIFHVYGSVSNDIITDSALENSGFVRIYNDKLHSIERQVYSMFGFKKRNLFYSDQGENRWSFEVFRRAYEIYNECSYGSIDLIRNSGEDKKFVQALDCNLLYIFGFGFDPLNLENIGLGLGVGHERWKDKCFVTNSGSIERVARLAEEHLCGISGRFFDAEKQKLKMVVSSREIKESLGSSFFLNEKTRISLIKAF